MKMFIISLFILTAICCASTISAVESIKRIDSMTEILDSVSYYDKNIPENAAEAAERFNEEWEKNMFLISMLLPHHHLDEVKEKLTSLKAYATTEEFAEWQEANLILKEELEHIRGLIAVTADNIL